MISDNIEINNYKLNLDFDLDKLSYQGNIIIDIIVKKQIDNIEINSEKITIKQILLNNNTIEWIEDKNKNIIIIKNKFKLIKYKIEIIFSNIINNEPDGIYWVKKNNKLIICTHLEPISARKFIPCFDYPDLKSVFDVIIQIDSCYNGISNCSINKSIIDSKTNKKIISFNPTPKMSTYLLCIVIGDIVPVLTKPLISNSGKKINGYCISEDTKYLHWSISNTLKALNYFEKWFDIEYTLDKLDIVSIPNFMAGAMENWGLVTFREEYVLLQNKYDNLEKIKILEVIYHEIAHQWFGNLVTLKTWNDLWLNESTATFFSWMALNDEFEKYDIPEMYWLLENKKLFIMDGITNTHPILLNTHEDINPSELFDEITYAKGNCVINYICGLIGKNNFRKSISKYLKSNIFTNTNSKDLYSYLDFDKNNSNIDFVNLTNNLINTKGFPIMYIKQNKNKLFIRFKKFNLDKTKINKFPHKLFIKIKLLFLNGKTSEKIVELDNINNNLIILSDNYDDNKEIPQFIINPNNELFCICYWKNKIPELTKMTQVELMKYVHDEFILALYSYKNIYYYLNLIHLIFELINLEKFTLLFYCILVDINKLIQIYFLSKINTNNIFSFIKNTFEQKILFYTKKILNTKITYTEMIIEQILLLEGLEIENNNILNVIKSIYIDNNMLFSNSQIYFTKIVYKYLMKYNQDEQIDNILSIIKNSKKITHINNAIESLHYLSDKNFDKVFQNYKSLLKSQDYIMFFSTISKITSKQTTIINYWIDSHHTILSDDEIQYKILKVMCYNIYNNNLINIILNYIDKNYLKTKNIIILKIKNILETNNIIYTNLS